MKRAILFAALAACTDDGATGDPGELVTTVVVDFTPVAGGAAQSFTFHDEDGDGGAPPMVMPVTIAPGMYTLAIKFENRLEMPAEDITTEVRDEGDQHQVFLTGTAVKGPATANATAPLEHSYTDRDANMLPIGLAHMVTATAGIGDLTVTLRHLPPLNDMPQKTMGLAMMVRTGGIASIPGDSDANVTFPVTVQ